MACICCIQCIDVGFLFIFIFHCCFYHYTLFWNVHTILLRNIIQIFRLWSPPSWVRPFTHHWNLLVPSIFFSLNTASASLQFIGLLLLYIFSTKFFLSHCCSRCHCFDVTSWRRDTLLFNNLHWWLSLNIKISGLHQPPWAVYLLEHSPHLSHNGCSVSSVLQMIVLQNYLQLEGHFPFC